MLKLVLVTCSMLLYSNHAVTAYTYSRYVTSPENCSMKFVQIRLRYNNCIPVRIVTRACFGWCPSYTMTSSTTPRHLDHSCSCCQYNGRRRKRFGIKCPYTKTSRRLRLLAVSFTVPRSCMCRPCSVLPNKLIPSEEGLFNKSPMFRLLSFNSAFKRSSDSNMTSFKSGASRLWSPNKGHIQSLDLETGTNNK